MEAIIVAVDPRQFALAAADSSALDAELAERLSGYDQALFDLARSLAGERAAGHPRGPLLWNDHASGFIDGLLVRHASKFKGLPPGRLDKQVFDRVSDYVLSHIGESMAYIERLDAQALHGTIKYQSTRSPAVIEQYLAPLLVHFFNHQSTPPVRAALR